MNQILQICYGSHLSTKPPMRPVRPKRGYARSPPPLVSRASRSRSKVTGQFVFALLQVRRALRLPFFGPLLAQALVRRGAKVDNVAAAAGLGRLAEAGQHLPAADAESRHRALALA